MKRNVDQYWSRGPAEPVEFRLDELVESMEAVYKAPRVRLLVSPEAWKLYRRLRDAPRRKKLFERVSWSEVDLVDDPAALPGQEGRYLDGRTGRGVVREDDGTLFRKVPYPAGAFTLGELVRLRDLLWAAAERAAVAAEANTLSPSDRATATQLVDSADELDMRMAVMKLQPKDSAESDALKRTVLEIMAREPNPRSNTEDLAKLKRRLMR